MTKSKIVIYALAVTVALSFILIVYQINENAALTREKDGYATKQEMTRLLQQVQQEVNAELNKLDENIKSACQQLSTTGLDGANARNVLADLVESNPLIVNAATSDIKDMLVAVEPSQYREIEGIDISDQEQNIKLHKTMRPEMSNMIPLVEGFPGVVMVAPIFNIEDKFIGALSIVIEPNVLINKTVSAVQNSFVYSFMAIQLDGQVIYDVDQEQIGTMTLSNPAYQNYPQLLAICQRMATEKSGYGIYEFSTSLSSTEVVKKECFWTTIGIYGTEWRLSIINTLS